MTLEEQIALKIKENLKNKDYSVSQDDDIKCEYCGTKYDAKLHKNCPNCGANNSKRY